MLEFGSPFTQNRLFFPPLLSQKFIVPTASVLTLNTVPFIFITGTPGSLIAPEQGCIIKQAGTAYTLGGATTLAIAYEDATALNTPFTVTGFFNSAALTMTNWAYITLPTSTSPADNWLGSGLRLLLAGGNLSGGDGDLYIYLQYRIWPFGTNLS